MSDRENRTGLFEMPPDPEVPDLFRVQIREAALQLRTHSVARVVASDAQPLGYDPVTQKASLSVEILQVVKDHFTPATPASPNPVNIQTPVLLKNIKVAWPRTAAGYLTFPLLPLDTGELHVQDRSIDQWRATGLASDPVSSFVHMLGDSVFHPNIRPDADPIVPPTSQVATVLEGPRINFGALATNPLLLGTGFGGPLTVWVTANDAAYVVWDGSAKTPADVVVLQTALSTSHHVFFATIAGWLSTKSFTE